MNGDLITGSQEVFCYQTNGSISGRCISRIFSSHFSEGHYAQGVLRYISDGEVRSPFLGLKLVILDFF